MMRLMVVDLQTQRTRQLKLCTHTYLHMLNNVHKLHDATKPLPGFVPLGTLKT